MEQTKKPEKISRSRRKALLKRLKAEIGIYQRDLYLAAFLGWLQFLTRIASFYLIAQIIAQLFLEKKINIGVFFWQLVILSVFGFGVALLARKYQGTASQYARNNLKQRFFEVFQKHSGEFEHKTSVADILTIASQGIDTLDTYFNRYLTSSLRTYFNCATVLVIVAIIFPLGGLIFLICLPFIPISIVFMQKRSRKIMQHYWATYMDVGNLFIDDLKGMNTLYTYNVDEKYAKSFVKKAEQFRLSTMELLKFQLQSVGYMDGVMYIGVGVSGFFAVLALAHGQLSLASLLFFVLIAAEFFAPIRESGYGMHLVMMNTRMADRIYSFLDSVDEIDKEVKTENLEDDIKQIELKNLSFSYDNNEILNKITVKIKKGNIFAIAGESGLGKTTLAKLIQKQLKPTEGEILFNTQDIAKVDAQMVQQKVLYVSPDSYLFNTSIYENLTLGTTKNKKELLDWLKEKNLLAFVAKLPEGIDTRVGENGKLLSPGQRQQIICARALLAQRPIYIFDEMTSSVDSETEQILFDYIKLTAENAIVLFISHKMRQVIQADEVLFINKKRENTVGQPQKVLESVSEFKQLVETQNRLEAILHE